MLRASAVCEQAGYPTSTLVCEGFITQSHACSLGFGMPNIPVAVVPSHPNVLNKEELAINTVRVTIDQVISNLTQTPAIAGQRGEPDPQSVVFKGTFDEVNQHFYENAWSDGLPFVPPTRRKIEAFLRCVDRDPNESLGTLLPENRAATIWSIAVNGVMAGCRPEYMPLLVTMVEAMADPNYGVEHSGNTPGADTLLILNGPIIKELGFNYTQGVMRDGFMPNTSVGRFWRLYLRNVAGLFKMPDKSTAEVSNSVVIVVVLKFTHEVVDFRLCGQQTSNNPAHVLVLGVVFSCASCQILFSRTYFLFPLAARYLRL